MRSQIFYTPFLPKKGGVDAQKVGTKVAFFGSKNDDFWVENDDFWTPPKNVGISGIPDQVPDGAPPKITLVDKKQHVMIARL